MNRGEATPTRTLGDPAMASYVDVSLKELRDDQRHLLDMTGLKHESE